ncbi:HigA family addiction module antitoxin [Planktothrix paucivesiculata]|uniref:Plasmid maintenance system antidote protein n=1 Tax=Planktothrix paucivesiculata PCC 9631 TaxID=671071 RepID=A0A7Z9BRX5_9CYAN|nr:HigA family addiction module antitoxin [Planktothrix paucivesiculata]VXD18879.1 Plasmid maintenance system antidote protein [Planktothrix paucivesiculata PCC 9631]
MIEPKLEPVHPGEILLEEFLNPMEITLEKLAEDIHISLIKIDEIIQGKSSITADIALRLSKYFELSERFWLNLQINYDLELAKDQLEDRLESEVLKFSKQSK